MKIPAEIIRIEEADYVVELDLPNDRSIRIYVPKDPDSFEDYQPYGLNLVFYGHYQ